MNLIRTLVLASILSAVLLAACDFPFPESEKSGIPDDHTEKHGIALHKPGLNHPYSEPGKCNNCHGFKLEGDFLKVEDSYKKTPSCYQCHGKKWEN